MINLVALGLAVVGLVSGCAGAKTVHRPPTPIPTRDLRLAELLIQELYRPGSTGYRITVEPPSAESGSPFDNATRQEQLRQLRSDRGDILFDIFVSIDHWPVEHARHSLTRHGRYLRGSNRFVYFTSMHDAKVWLKEGLLSLQLSREVRDEKPVVFISFSHYGPWPAIWGDFTLERGRKEWKFAPNPGPIAQSIDKRELPQLARARIGAAVSASFNE